MVLIRGTFRGKPAQVQFRRLENKRKFAGHWRVNITVGGKSYSDQLVCKPCWAVAEGIMDKLIPAKPRTSPPLKSSEVDDGSILRFRSA